MDEEILKSKGVTPRHRRVGVAKGYRLRIGSMATLLRDVASKAYGMIYSLTHDEIDTLYVKSGLSSYIVESLLVTTPEGEDIATLCCSLLNPPSYDEHNDAYRDKLFSCMQRYNLPLPQKDSV